MTGILQIFFGLCRLGSQMKYIPRAVMLGFVNSLAILIFMAQLPQLTNVPSAVYIMTAIGLAIIYILPRFTKAVPSPLVAIIVLTTASLVGKIDVPTVGDMGELPNSLPFFALPNVPFNFDTLEIIFPYALTLSIVGLLESLLTASLLHELTDTPSDKNQEAKGQGIANIIGSLVFENLELHIVTVTKNREDSKAIAVLEEGEKMAQQAGFKPVCHLIEGHAEKAIAQYESEKGINLLLMGAYGHSRIRQSLVALPLKCFVAAISQYLYFPKYFLT